MLNHVISNRTRKYACFLILLIALWNLFSSSLQAQSPPNSTLDSLKEVLRTHGKEDAVKVNTLLSLSSHYNNAQPDSSIYFLHQALALSKKIDFRKGEARVYRELAGRFHFNFDSSYYYLKFAALAAKQVNDSSSLGNTYYDLAFTLFAGTNISGRENEATINRDAALYIDSAATVFRAIGNSGKLIDCLTRKAEIWMYINQMPEALATLESAISVFHTSTLKGLPVSNQYFTKGEYHFRNSEFDSALVYHQKTLPILEEENSIPGMAYALGWVARDYSKLGKYNLAIESAERGLKMAEESHLMKEKLDLITALYEVYKEKKDYAKALKYYEQLFRETDSLNVFLMQESTSKFNLQLEAQKKPGEDYRAGKRP